MTKAGRLIVGALALVVIQAEAASANTTVGSTSTISGYGNRDRLGTIKITGTFGTGIPILEQVPGGISLDVNGKSFELKTVIQTAQRPVYTGLRQSPFGNFVDSYVSHIGCNMKLAERPGQVCPTSFISIGGNSTYMDVGDGVDISFLPSSNLINFKFGGADEFWLPPYLKGSFSLPLDVAGIFQPNSISINGAAYYNGNYAPGNPIRFDTWALGSGTYRFDSVPLLIADNIRVLNGFIPSQLFDVTVVITGGVPEPDTWIQFIAAFGIVGAIQRKRSLASARNALAA